MPIFKNLSACGALKIKPSRSDRVFPLRVSPRKGKNIFLSALCVSVVDIFRFVMKSFYKAKLRRSGLTTEKNK
jgi:hypothetical protein